MLALVSLDLIGFSGHATPAQISRARTLARESVERLLATGSLIEGRRHALACYANHGTACPNVASGWRYRDAVSGPRWLAVIDRGDLVISEKGGA